VVEESLHALSDGVRLNLVKAGPDDGPLVVLLHGFPEFWYGWRHQIGPLADAGYRVVVPDQRGYNRSDKPQALAAYGLDVLAGDILGVIEASGRSTAMVVGHDWGGVIAWRFALEYPDRVERLLILNAPHPAAYRRYVLRHASQLRKSWYVLLFQLPVLPERRLARRNWLALKQALVRTSRPGTFSQDDLANYERAWSQPGAIHAMLNWYRALVGVRFRRLPDARVRVPTNIIWGVRDHFLDSALADESLALCEQGSLVRLETATHWLQHEFPTAVNRLLLESLSRTAPGVRDIR
jgi:pimeloyl-ACP methyl ester carboxylesterase